MRLALSSNKPVLIFSRLILPFLVIFLFQISPFASELQENREMAKLNAEFDHKERLIVNYLIELEYEPWRSQLWQSVGHLYFETGDFEQTVFYLQKSAGENLLSIEGVQELGDAFFLSGNVKAAVEAWRKLFTGTSNDAVLYETIYQVCLDAGELEYAQQILFEWVTFDPQNPYLKYLLARMQIPSNIPLALDLLQAAAAQDTEYLILYQSLSEISADLEELPLDSYQMLLLGRALGKADEWELAEAVLDEAVNLSPDYGEAWAFLAEARQRLGKDGSQEITKAKEFDPDSLLVKTMEAAYWRRQNKPEMALIILHEAADIEPENPVWQLEIANVLAEMGNIHEADDYYQKAILLDPLNADYWIRLARFCFQNNLNIYETGIPAARQALVISPENAEAVEVMGHGMLAVRDYTSAERYFHRALELSPDYVDAHLHLGQLYILLEKTDDAYSQIQTALSLAEEGSQQQIIARRILQRYWGIED